MMFGNKRTVISVKKWNTKISNTYRFSKKKLTRKFEYIFISLIE